MNQRHAQVEWLTSIVTASCVPATAIKKLTTFKKIRRKKNTPCRLNDTLLVSGLLKYARLRRDSFVLY
jgi:hypothetical protein